MGNDMTKPLSTDSTAPLRGTPQREYTDPAIFEQELAQVFGNDWVMIGRQGSIPEPGNYMTATVGTKPVVCIRQKDGSIRAFANFCLHRYAKLLDGRGKAGRIVCPYHAWTYEITGPPHRHHGAQGLRQCLQVGDGTEGTRLRGLARLHLRGPPARPAAHGGKARAACRAPRPLRSLDL